MSRVLLLLPSVPEPADSGARLRNLMLLRLLAEQHTVDAIAFGTDEDAARLARLVERSRVVAPPRRSLAQRALTLAGARLPDMAERLWSPAAAETVRCMAQQADIVQAEGVEMARYLSLVPPDKRVYDAHNPEFLLQRRLSETAPTAMAKLYSRLQWQRLEGFERAVVKASRLTLAVSQHDANQLRALANGGCVKVVPNGIDVQSFAVRPDPGTRDLLFVGKLDYRPNTDAVRWLIEAVLPNVPEARLFVVGANPPRWLVQAGQQDARIAVTGYVDDERPYLRRCAALVLPLRVGAGSRLKALVAMASGVPIVSTSLGMEGLEVQAGLDHLQAESATQWAHALRQVLIDAALREGLAHRARKVVEERYDWQAVRAAVLAAYAT